MAGGPHLIEEDDADDESYLIGSGDVQSGTEDEEHNAMGHDKGEIAEEEENGSKLAKNLQLACLSY
jgi:hypothetical protein